MRTLLLFPCFALLAACSHEGAPEATQDVKVDHNGKDDPVESSAPRTVLCGTTLYAVWEDDQHDTSRVMFNSSVDFGLTWMPGDVQINDADANAGVPDIACAGDNVYVVWEDERDGDLRYHNIYGDVSTDKGRSWGDEDLLLDGDVDGEAMSLGPRVVADGDSAYVAWFDASEGAYDVYVQATTDAGGHWLDAPTRADTDTAGEAYSAWPRLATDGAGRVVVAWEDSRDGSSDIYVNVSDDDGATFGRNDSRLDGGDDPGAANSFLPSIALAGDDVYVVWHDERNGEERDIFMNASSDGGHSWNDEAIRVDTDDVGKSDSVNPVIAAVDGRVHIAWQDDRSGGYDIFHRSSSNGGVDWEGGETRLDTDANGESQSYDPVMLVRGDIVLVSWQDRRSDDEGVGFDDLYYNYSEDGGKNWSGEDLRINSNEPGTSYAVNQSLSLAEGGIIAVWADGRFGTSDIFCAKRLLGEDSVYIAPKTDDEK